MRRIILPGDVAASDVIGKGKKGVGDPTPPPLPEGTKPDDYQTQLLKLIPAESVTLFITINGIVQYAGPAAIPPWAFWAITVVMVIGTYLLVMRNAQVDDLARPDLQIILSTVSFVVWVFAVGGPFNYGDQHWYNNVWGEIVLSIYTFFVPLLLPRVPKSS